VKPSYDNGYPMSDSDGREQYTRQRKSRRRDEYYDDNNDNYVGEEYIFSTESIAKTVSNWFLAGSDYDSNNDDDDSIRSRDGRRRRRMQKQKR